MTHLKSHMIRLGSGGLGVLALLAGSTAHAGEADLVMPDLSSVSFMGMPGRTLLMFGILVALGGRGCCCPGRQIAKIRGGLGPPARPRSQEPSRPAFGHVRTPRFPILPGSGSIAALPFSGLSRRTTISWPVRPALEEVHEL